MAFFFPPPPVATGGSQPYGSIHNVTPPVATPLDNPPISLTTTPNAVLLAWVPLPPQPYYGQTRVTPPVSVVPSQPPLFSNLVNNTIILTAWVPPPPPPSLGELSAGTLGWSTDNPPWERFSPTPWTVPERTIPYQSQSRPVVTPSTPLNNPPFTSRFSWLPNIVQAWQPDLSVSPSLGTPRFTVGNDNPPFTSRFSWTDPVVSSWLPKEPQPTLPKSKITTGGASPDNPPFTGRFTWDDPIVASWQPGPPLPILPVKLTPSSVTPDNPPFSSRFTWTDPVVAAWQAGPPLPTLNTKQIQAGPSLDNPPFTGRFSWENSIIASWLIDTPRPIVSKPSVALPGWFNDDPPFSSRQKQTSYDSWQVVYPTTLLPSKLVQPGVAPDNPPLVDATPGLLT